MSHERPPPAIFKICWGARGLQLWEPWLTWKGDRPARRQGLGRRDGLQGNRRIPMRRQEAVEGTACTGVQITTTYTVTSLTQRAFSSPQFNYPETKCTLQSIPKEMWGTSGREVHCGAIVGLQSGSSPMSIQPWWRTYNSGGFFVFVFLTHSEAMADNAGFLPSSQSPSLS